MSHTAAFLVRRGWTVRQHPNGLQAKRGGFEIFICGEYVLNPLICLYGRNIWKPIAIVWP